MTDASDNTTPILVAAGVHKRYRLGGQDLHILRGVDLSVPAGRWLAILGASGSGKSTLLHLLGGLDRPGKGTIQYQGRNLREMSVRALDAYRSRQVGFVFQSYHLLPELTAMENVVLSAMIPHGVLQWPGSRRAVRQRAAALLGRVGLGERLHHKPSKLSGGERQRVAIARALVNEPAILLADEPTGNLDVETGQQILEIFQGLRRDGQTIVMVTHDPRVAALADERLTLDLGRITPAPAPGSIPGSTPGSTHESIAGSAPGKADGGR